MIGFTYGRFFMLKLQLLSLFTAGSLLLHPLTAAAADAGETVALTPPDKMPAVAGVVSLVFDRDLNGTIFEIYRIQPEGEFLYYTYRVTLCDGLTVDCPLWEGEYRLVLSCVRGDSAERRERRCHFSISDPDNDLSFDQSHLIYEFHADPEAELDMSDGTEFVNDQRTLTAKFDYRFAQPAFFLGDLDGDQNANAADAALILMAAAEGGAGAATGLTSLAEEEADINGDQVINSVDAAELLLYAAANAAGNFSGDLLDYVRSGTDRAENATVTTEIDN